MNTDYQYASEEFKPPKTEKERWKRFAVADRKLKQILSEVKHDRKNTLQKSL